MYNSSVPALSASMLERAKAAGYGAVVVTLDTVKYGYRTEELDAAYFPQCKCAAAMRWVTCCADAVPCLIWIVMFSGQPTPGSSGVR